MGRPHGQDVSGAVLSRRTLFKGGGALVVGFAVAGPGCQALAETAGPSGVVAPKAIAANSWIEIHADNTILLRTGQTDFGQGSPYTAYKQIVAEELGASVEAITSVVTGDPDRTPDGGASNGFLFGGNPNVRKVAAYVYQALLDLGAEHFGVPRDQLVGENGRFTTPKGSVTYGELVSGRDLKLTVPVMEFMTYGYVITGKPPFKPVSQYKIIGQSIQSSAIAEKVAARAEWITDVRLPGVLHARIVRPATLGSKLISAGAVDASKFPTAKAVVVGNLVAVVSENEWEATRAAQQVATLTKWTDWKGLPGSDGMIDALRKLDWKTTVVQMGDGSKADVQPALAGAAKRLKATYYLPYVKHAPIGPSVAVADVRPALTTVHAHTQNAKFVRKKVAQMLGVSIDAVVVRTYTGTGHYGRSNGGAGGAEDEAVILSKTLGRPVRVQWTRAEEMQWSTQSPTAICDIDLGLDAKGRIVAYQAEHYQPARVDERPVGAMLAGWPTDGPPSEHATSWGEGSTVSPHWDPWIYTRTTEISERSHGARQIGQDTNPYAFGLRGHSMRSPGQRQQNFPREMAINEAAAMAGADPLQFRLDHTDDPRAIGVLNALRDKFHWEPRPSPAPGHASQGDKPLRGRGLAILTRANCYWAAACEITVTPSTGVITVDRFVVVAEPGIVINPQHLKRQVEGGVTMGISHALKEELLFDESGITQANWRDYPLLTMGETPPIEVVLINRPEVGSYGGASEAGNMMGGPTIAAALHDATGKFSRRLPLTPTHVKALLST